MAFAVHRTSSWVHIEQRASCGRRKLTIRRLLCYVPLKYIVITSPITPENGDEQDETFKDHGLQKVSRVVVKIVFAHNLGLGVNTLGWPTTTSNSFLIHLSLPSNPFHPRLRFNPLQSSPCPQWEPTLIISPLQPLLSLHPRPTLVRLERRNIISIMAFFVGCGWSDAC